MDNLSAQNLINTVTVYCVIYAVVFIAMGFVSLYEAYEKKHHDLKFYIWPWILIAGFPIGVSYFVYAVGFIDVIEQTFYGLFDESLLGRLVVQCAFLTFGAVMWILNKRKIINIKYSDFIVGLAFIVTGGFELTHRIQYQGVDAVTHFSCYDIYILSITFMSIGIFQWIELITKKEFPFKLIWGAILIFHGTLLFFVHPEHILTFVFQSQYLPRDELSAFFNLTSATIVSIPTIIILIILYNKGHDSNVMWFLRKKIHKKIRE